MSGPGNQHRHAFTPAEDAEIVVYYRSDSVRAIGRRIGRQGESVGKRLALLARRGLVDLERRWCYQRVWTADDDDVIREWYGLRPDAALAKWLRRTPNSVRTRAFLLRRRKDDFRWTATRAAQFFGIDWHKLLEEWVRPGLIAAQRDGLYWVVDDASLERFIRRYPWHYDPARIDRDDPLGAIAHRVHAADPWLTPAQVARLKGVSSDWVCRACRSGGLPAERTKGQGGHDVWKIRQSAARQWQARNPSPRRGTYHGPKLLYTPEEDAYLLANYARRPWREIAVHLGRSMTSAQKRYRRLERDTWARQAKEANEGAA